VQSFNLARNFGMGQFESKSFQHFLWCLYVTEQDPLLHRVSHFLPSTTPISSSVSPYNSYTSASIRLNEIKQIDAVSQQPYETTNTEADLSLDNFWVVPR
jgi:hypothetical protein